MQEHPELVFSYLLGRDGRAEALDWSAVVAWTKDGGPIWVHLDGKNANTDDWLLQHSGLDTFVIDGLMASDARPRCDWYDDGILLVLRGVNLNPGADPEDMVSIRIWIEEHRVISTRRRHLMAVEDIRTQWVAGKGPVSTGHLVARLAAAMTERMGPVVADLGDRVADIEEKLVEKDDDGEIDLRSVRHLLIDLRRVSISLRRYIAPQRDALNRLSQLEEEWLDDRVRGRLRQTVDRVTQIVEELDEVRERSALIQDELVSRIAHRMERTMYVLTIVATIMLPLGVLTGLLGVNVGGVPGAETSWAFWALSAGLVSLVAIEIWVFKRLKWL